MHQPGTLIEGKYEILGKLREGGMGTLYRVRHKLLDEVRVVKVLKAGALGNEEMKRRFVEEARTATRLKHPNICTIHDFALDDEGKAYLVMEFIDGVNLADLVRRQGPRTLGLTLEIAQQTLSALGYLHRKNVVHRDVAPDNLMLTQDEERRPLIKVIDLGIAKTLDRPGEMTSTGVFLGKLKYASPEQFGSLPTGEKLDGRSDLYALGVVLYEILTGKYPFVGQSPSELLRAHLFDHHIPFDRSDPEGKIPADVRAALTKAMEKRREDRFATAEEFSREIVALKAKHAQPHDLDDTAQLISRVREMPGGNREVTPSFQDRLDRQFMALTTPHPQPSTPRRVQFEEAQTEVVPRAATDPAAEVDTKPLGRRRENRPWLIPAVVAAAAIAAVLAVALLWRSRPAAVASPQPAPTVPALPRGSAGLPASSAVEPIPQAPSPVPATAAPEATAPPSAPTAAPPEPPKKSSKEARDPEQDLRRSRAQAEQARSRAADSRDRAVKAHAAEQAAALYEFGVSKEKEGQALLSRGQAAAALAAFEASRDFFDKAEPWSRSHPAPRPTAAEKVAAAPEPTVRREPANAPPTPAPAAARVAPPAEPPRAAERVTDEDRIRDTIRRYEKAQSSLDPDLYAAVYPGVDKARVRAAFGDLRSQTLEFEIQRIEMAPGATTAQVRGLEKRVAVPRVGSEQHLSTTRVLTLEKRGESWVITRLGS